MNLLALTTKNKHTLISSEIGGKNLDVLKFYTSPEDVPLRTGDLFMAIVSLGINEFRGCKSISMIAEDILPIKFDQKKYFSAYSTFDAFMRSEELPQAYYPVMLPNRNTAMKIYAAIPHDGISADKLYLQIMDEKLNYCRFCTVIEAFRELGIISMSSNRIYKIPVKEKKDFASAAVISTLGSMIRK